MNEKNSYEKSLAEKFGQIPPPGSASEHWPQMKALLDKDLPVGGAKGPGGFGRWWLYALIGGIVITAGWWFSTGNSYEKDKAPQLSNVSSPATENEKLTSKTNSDKTDNNDINFTPTNKNQESTEAANNAIVTSPANKEPKAEAPLSSIKDKATEAASANGNSTEVATNSNESKPAETKLVTTSVKKNNDPGIVVISKNKETNEKNPVLVLKSDAGTNKNTVSKKDKTKKSGLDGSSLAVETVAAKNRFEKVVKGASDKSKRGNYAGAAKADKSIQPESGVSLTSLPDNGSVKAKPSIVRISIEGISRQFTGPSLSDTVNAEFALAIGPIPLQIPAPSRFKMETARTKALKNRIVGTGDDKQFVFGLSLPLAFPIGTQENLAYNINAGSSALSNFIPIPHFQYHLSDKAYLQTEFQFIAPQFIQSFKAYEKKKEVVSATNYRFLTSSIYVQKLYYFNLPVVAYYSPFKNFYLGTGLQYSKLLSGIAQYEDRIATSMQTGARDSLVRSDFRKFKNDSVSNKLAGHDFRFIFDANYYWHRFTVGMRYTQALSDFVSIQLTNNTPIYTDRNKALQFYLRYNIWEDKRKKKPALVAWR